MQQYHGTYQIDLENSAKLHAGWFHERFVMKPGYDEAAQQYMKQNAALVGAISLVLSADALTVRSGGDEERFHIEWSPDNGAASFAVDWHGDRDRFVIHELAPGSIHLKSGGNQLSEWAWKRAE